MRIKHLLCTVAIVFFSFAASAQTKVGTVNINIIVSKLPEIAQVKTGIQAYEKQLQNDLKVKLDAYQKEVEEANKVVENQKVES